MKPQANFDGIARPYRWLEYATLGRTLERTRTHFLPELDACRSALVLGDGDGRFTAALLASNQDVRVYAVDRSARMLALLRGNARRASLTAERRLRTTQADALELEVSRKTDLVVTHFFLDCLTQAEVDALVGRLTRGLVPGALWLVSDFRIPAGLLHWPARLYVRSLYLAFRILTGLRVTQLPDYAAALRAAGWTAKATHHGLFGLLTTELWSRAAEA